MCVRLFRKDASTEPQLETCNRKTRHQIGVLLHLLIGALLQVGVLRQLLIGF